MLPDAAGDPAQSQRGVITTRLSDARPPGTSAREYADAAHAGNTKRAYRSDVADFGTWCERRGRSSLPADGATLGDYLTDLANRGMKFSTIRRRISAINGAHADAGFEAPSRDADLRRIVQGIGRTIGAAQHRKDALTVDLLVQAMNALGSVTVRSARDKAILLLGFSAALRRSELAALDVRDVKFTREGLALTLRRSKTDQTGEADPLGIPRIAQTARCAVAAVRYWLRVSGIEAGPLFRDITPKDVVTDQRISDASVARLVKRAAKMIGLDGDFSGHSLRAGFVTSGAQAGVSERSIAKMTRHKSMSTLAGYIRRANIFEDSALVEIMR